MAEPPPQRQQLPRPLPPGTPDRSPLTTARQRTHANVGDYRGPRSGWPLMLLLAAVLGGLTYGGYKLYQRFVLGERKASLECGLIIETKFARCQATFHAYPSGERTDVRVELSGPTLVRPLSYDWKFLAPLDARYGPAHKPTDPPTLGRELLWRMPLGIVPTLRAGVGDFIVTAKLFWGGKQQDRALFNTKVLFETK